MNTLKRKIAFLLIFGILCITAIIIGWEIIAPKFNYQPPKTTVASALKPSQPLKAFSLQATTGQLFTEKSLRGHWTLIFFGYPGCPDICPKTLGIVRDTWAMFKSQQHIPVRFVFADIGKEPVPLDQLKNFLHNYRPEFIGLTGTPEQMHQLSDQLGIYANQMSDYLDHTTALMLIDTQGRLHAVFTPPFTAQELYQDLELFTK